LRPAVAWPGLGLEWAALPDERAEQLTRPRQSRSLARQLPGEHQV